MAKIEAGQGPRFPRVAPTPSYPKWVLGSVAVVAAAAGLLLWLSSTEPRPAPPHEPDAKLGPPSAPARRRIEGLAQGLQLSRPGLASLWLDPGASGWLDEPGGRLSLVLDQGAVTVEVTPQQQPDRVEVIAGKVRVSVKGTRFRVARLEGRVDVDVERGTVQVSSTDEPTEVRPTLLTGPAGGSFSALDAKTLGRDYRPFGSHAGSPNAPTHGSANGPAGGPPAVSASGPAASVASNSLHPDTSHSHGPSAPATSPPAKTSEPAVSAPTPAPKLSRDEVEAQVKAAAQGCFESSTNPPQGVTVRIEPTLTMQVGPGGSVQAFSFSPSPSLAFEACFQKSTARLNGSPGSYSVPLKLQSAK